MAAALLVNELLALEAAEGIKELVDEELGSRDAHVFLRFLINSNMFYIKKQILRSSTAPEVCPNFSSSSKTCWQMFLCLLDEF